MPKRIQLSRRKGWRMPSGTINCARPGIFGNHVAVAFGYQRFPEQAVQLYRCWLTTNSVAWYSELRAEVLRRLPMLRGHDLACWCKLTDCCHVDILLELANA